MRLRWRILWSLLWGAVLCVLVAWACALWSETLDVEEWYANDGPLPASAPQVPAAWLIPRQTDGRCSGGYRSYSGVGLRYRERVVIEMDRGIIHGYAAAHTWYGWESGWPMRALSCSGASDDTFPKTLSVGWGVAAPDVPHMAFHPESLDGQTYIPLKPMPAGLIVDTLLYGTATLLCLSLCAAARGRWRTRRGRCGNCGYDRTGLSRDPPAPCPECGAKA